MDRKLGVVATHVNALRDREPGMQRWLGIDYGTRRIGTAIGDTQLRIASPAKVIDARGEPTRDARAVSDLGAALEVDGFVVGLPLSMDDTDSDQTRLTRRFAD